MLSPTQDPGLDLVEGGKLEGELQATIGEFLDLLAGVPDAFADELAGGNRGGMAWEFTHRFTTSQCPPLSGPTLRSLPVALRVAICFFTARSVMPRWVANSRDEISEFSEISARIFWELFRELFRELFSVMAVAEVFGGNARRTVAVRLTPARLSSGGSPAF